MWESLNRTSVGLKHRTDFHGKKPRALPQSNQRGIETWPSLWQWVLTCFRLNRTSVGLKQVCNGFAVAFLWGASIEPAWD